MLDLRMRVQVEITCDSMSCSRREWAWAVVVFRSPDFGAPYGAPEIEKIELPHGWVESVNPFKDHECLHCTIYPNIEL